MRRVLILATVATLLVAWLGSGGVMAEVSPLQSPVLQHSMEPYYPEAYPWQIVPCLDPAVEAAGGICIGPAAEVWYP